MKFSLYDSESVFRLLTINLILLWITVISALGYLAAQLMGITAKDQHFGFGTFIDLYFILILYIAVWSLLKKKNSQENSQ